MTQPYSAVQYLTGELQRKLAEAREITEKADSESRQLTDNERVVVERALKEASEIKTRVTEFNANEELREKIIGLGVVTVEGEEKAKKSDSPKSWGDAFVNSPQFKALIDRGMQGTWQTEPIQVGLKAPILESTGQNDDAIGIGWDPTLRTPGLIQPPLTIADLLPSGTTNLPSFKYPVVLTRTAPSGESVTAEGALKPEAGFTFDDATVTLEKLAAFVAASDEMLSDSPAIAAYINAQLPLMVRQAEEFKLATELYAADGVGPVDGTTVEPGTPTGFDAIAEAIAVIRMAGLEPNGILIHPMDEALLQASKTATFGYYGGSPWTSPPNNPWGLRAVVSQAATQGTPLVGDFARGGQVWRRGGVSVDASNSHEDYFRRNLVAIRAEERVGLAVYYPEAFLTVTLPAGAS